MRRFLIARRIPPLIGLALQAIAACLQQASTMRSASKEEDTLALRLTRLQALTTRAGADAAFVEAHAAIFEGQIATLSRAERALAAMNER
jgi:hypothetical protein